MAPRRPKRPTDPNQLGKLIVDLSTGDASENMAADDGATAFARQGGLKGGKARAHKLSTEERRKIAKAAALARWRKRPAT